MNSFRLRLITNLHCNFNCYFCYQKVKTNLVLSIPQLKERLLYQELTFERASVMGGESTLLENLPLYFQEIKPYCKTIGLTTNGYLLTEAKLLEYKKAGLNELGISIPSIKHFRDITGKHFSTIESNLKLAMKIFPRTRINITQNKFNIDKEIYEMIVRFNGMGLGVVICEDITNKFEMNFEKYLDAKLVSNEYGFETYSYKNGQFSFFHNFEKYNNTDLIITPIGTFTTWQQYCEAVKTPLIQV